METQYPNHSKLVAILAIACILVLFGLTAYNKYIVDKHNSDWATANHVNINHSEIKK